MDAMKLLDGAYDIHIHSAPDVIPRAQTLPQILREASRAGMAGIGIKDHTAPTVGRAALANEMNPGGPRVFSAIALNPPVGSLNPTAAEAALAEGCDIVYFPTYGAKHHIEVLGRGTSPGALPLPADDWPGTTILDPRGGLKPEVETIVELVARHDAVLATGHLTPAECLALLKLGMEAGVTRMLLTHGSELVPGADVDAQMEAVACGALVEQCFLAATEGCPGSVTLRDIADQVRAIGVRNCILSSDFGQVANGPVVEGFAAYLGKLRELGFEDDEMRTMIVENPRRLLEDRGVR